MTVRQSQSYIATDDERFDYKMRSPKAAPFGTAFIALEHVLGQSDFFVQFGAEYTYFKTIDLHGIHTVGIEPETSTLYAYSLRSKSQQYQVVGKLFATTYRILHPYVAAGLGGAVNQWSQYKPKTQETGSINLTAQYQNHQQSSWSYSLGLGLDADITQHVRAGLGYRFQDLGAAALGRGQVVMNQYQYPVDFTIRTAHNYLNQWMIHLSFVI